MFFDNFLPYRNSYNYHKKEKKNVYRINKLYNHIKVNWLETLSSPFAHMAE